ncbi:hypothetical protein IAR50_002487 [Cryptococcus sp. DSM 104548]
MPCQNGTILTTTLIITASVPYQNSTYLPSITTLQPKQLVSKPLDPPLRLLRQRHPTIPAFKSPTCLWEESPAKTPVRLFTANKVRWERWAPEEINPSSNRSSATTAEGSGFFPTATSAMAMVDSLHDRRPPPPHLPPIPPLLLGAHACSVRTRSTPSSSRASVSGKLEREQLGLDGIRIIKDLATDPILPYQARQWRRLYKEFKALVTAHARFV